MDDDRKKFPRKGGSKPGGPRGRDGAPNKGGKPGFAGKPRAEGGKPFVKRDSADRPFAKRRDDAAGGAERPKRDFQRDDRPRAEGAKPFVKRDSGDRPFAKRRDDAAGGAERPKRDFQGGKPFVKRDSGDRPFAKRRDDAAGGADRPKRDFQGGKPFVKRDGADRPFAKRRDDAAGGAERPKRDFQRDDRPRTEGARPFVKREGGSDFHKRPRPEGASFEKRDGFRSARTEREGRGGEGFSRENRNEEFRGERPARQFDRPRAPREGGFEGRPRPEGGRGEGAPRKPFVRAEAAEEEVQGERIAKRLARVGIASRRDAEELIAAGRVRVNGKALTSPAFNVMPEDKIELDGETIPPVERTR